LLGYWSHQAAVRCRTPIHDGRLHSRCHHVGSLVLPRSDYLPASIGQRLIEQPVAFPVAFDLRAPVLGVHRRRLVVLRTSMPVAPVDEDCHPPSGKDEVCFPANLPKRAVVYEVAVTSRVQYPSHSELRRGVATAVRLHVGSTGVVRRLIVAEVFHRLMMSDGSPRVRRGQRSCAESRIAPGHPRELKRSGRWYRGPIET